MMNTENAITILKEMTGRPFGWQSEDEAIFFIVKRIKELEKQLAAMNEPLITSQMKADCIGEFTFKIEEPCPKCYLKLEEKFDDIECLCDGCEEQAYSRSVVIPWGTCKEIYKAMVKSALRDA